MHVSVRSDDPENKKRQKVSKGRNLLLFMHVILQVISNLELLICIFVMEKKTDSQNDMMKSDM